MADVKYDAVVAEAHAKRARTVELASGTAPVYPATAAAPAARRQPRAQPGGFRDTKTPGLVVLIRREKWVVAATAAMVWNAALGGISWFRTLFTDEEPSSALASAYAFGMALGCLVQTVGWGQVAFDIYKSKPVNIAYEASVSAIRDQNDADADAANATPAAAAAAAAAAAN